MKVALAAYQSWMLKTAPLPMMGALAVIVAASLAEGLGIALLPSILGVAGLDVQGDGTLGAYTQTIARAFAALGIRPTLATLLVMFVLLTGMSALLSRLRYTVIVALDQKSLLALRSRLYRAIVNANWLFLARSRPSEFAHALTTELARVGQITILFLMLAAEIVVGVVYAMMAFIVSPSFAGLMLVAAVVLIFLLRGRVRTMHASGAKFSAATQRLHSDMSEVLHHLKTAKTYGAEGRHMELFAASNQNVMDAAIDMGRQRASAGAVFEFGSVLILGSMIYFLIEIQHLPAVAVLLLLLIFSRLMPYLQSGHQHFRELVSMLPSFVTVMDQVKRCEAAAEHPSDRNRVLLLRSSIALDAVTFSYDADNGAGVRSVDLVIPAGKVVALVGSSGAGKSTIVDLVMGLISPQSGSIKLDGVELTPIDAFAWRRQIGYVAQDVSLFNLSIRDNMLWASPAASDDDIQAALQLGGAADFVRALPRGIDTVVGERGVLFSQGERQRLGLARAMLRNPALLILDEATNGLDSETEAEVMRQVGSLAGGTTVLLVAHRLSTIRWADTIYVVDSGRVEESGTWADLSIRKEGRFRALCKAQFLVP